MDKDWEGIHAFSRTMANYIQKKPMVHSKLMGLIQRLINDKS